MIQKRYGVEEWDSRHLNRYSTLSLINTVKESCIWIPETKQSGDLDLARIFFPTSSTTSNLSGVDLQRLGIFSSTRNGSTIAALHDSWPGVSQGGFDHDCLHSPCSYICSSKTFSTIIISVKMLDVLYQTFVGPFYEIRINCSHQLEKLVSWCSWFASTIGDRDCVWCSIFCAAFLTSNQSWLLRGYGLV